MAVHLLSHRGPTITVLQ